MKAVRCCDKHVHVVDVPAPAGEGVIVNVRSAGICGSGLLAQRLDWIQAYSFMLFTLIYTPCLSTLATLRSESGSDRVMWASLAWSLGAAWLLSFAFYQTARALFG